MASALTQMKQLIGLLETALNNANRAEAKGSENEQAIVEAVAIQEENDTELLYQVCLLQLGITEDEFM